jgi:Flp pilus assembly protein TadD
MPKPALELILLLAAAALAGCAGQPAKLAEPEVVRPVIVVERAQTELMAALEMLRTGKLKQAEIHLEEIIKARPDIAEAHFNLGWTRHQLNQHDKAINHFQDGLRLRPDDVQALNLLGVSQRESGRFAEAEASYLKAIALSPGFDKPLLNLGILYELYLKQRPQALARYQQYLALQKTPDPRVAGWVAYLERQEARQ